MVNRLERGQPGSRMSTLGAVEKALARAGVEFLSAGEKGVLRSSGESHTSGMRPESRRPTRAILRASGLSESQACDLVAA